MARFARMQVESVPHADSFHAAGLPDRRPRVLADQVARLLDDPLTHEALQPDERNRLRALGPRIHALAQRLARAQPPATLIHGDLDSTNVAIRDGHAVFYDWTDAAVSHPFLDLVVMLPRAQEQLPDHPDAAERVREAYLAVWTEAGFAPTGPSADSMRAVCRDALTAGSLHQAINYRNILAATGREDRPEWLSGLARFLRRALERLAAP